MAKSRFLKESDQNIATQSNGLVEASYRMSVPAKRVMLMLLSKIHPGQKCITEKIKIDAIEYASKTGIDLSQSYKDIKKGSRELMKTIITTRDTQAKTTEECVVVSWMKYHDSEGWLEATFTLWIAPYIHQLTKIGYTTIAVDEALKFKTFYTVRFYELMMQFDKTGERYITLKNLRSCLHIEKKKYSRFTDLRRYVIEPSIKEIQEKTNWVIDWEPIKNKRQVESLSILFEKGS